MLVIRLFKCVHGSAGVLLNACMLMYCVFLCVISYISVRTAINLAHLVEASAYLCIFVVRYMPGSLKPISQTPFTVVLFPFIRPLFRTVLISSCLFYRFEPPQVRAV